MHSRTIKYTNFNGREVERTFYFNITKAELTLREAKSDGTWSESLKKIAASNKASEVLPEFEKLVEWSYGEKSEDGESFVKSDDIWAKFVNSEPWSALIMDLLTNAGESAQFFNAILPADIAAANREAQAVDGFRPGANTERPVAPTSGEQPQSRREALASESTPSQSGGPYGSQPAPAYETPAVVTPPAGFFQQPTAAEAGITRQSTPREDPPLINQQQ